MPNTYFDHNQNLQIHGDITFVSTGGEVPQDNHSTFLSSNVISQFVPNKLQGFFQVRQRVQATNSQSRTFERGFKLLCDNTAPSARYGSGQSFAGPQCHPGTRIAVQDYIFRWLDDEHGQIAMWMNGPVGIGKSAIAQTVAHLAAERGQLSSAFFFFRSDNTRNTMTYLVPTLAYEMTQQLPHTLDPVCQTIGANPLIFSSPLERQIRDTLLRPLCPPSESFPRRRMLIIIDGLDECLDTNTQQVIIRSFISTLLSAATEMIPHKILIVSRPESHIASAFSTASIFPDVKHLALDSWDTQDDIGVFLRAKLDEIQRTHPLRHYLPEIWPDYDSFRSLRKKSVGSFAYASLSIRYLASHNDNPERALQELLVLRPNRTAAAFADLDTLYRHILLNLEPELRFTVQKVLCLYVYSSEGRLESLAACLSEEKSVVETALIRVSSLIQIYNSGGRQQIKLHHSSFGEFLRDKVRSGNLYVFSPKVASAVATALSKLWLHPTYNMVHSTWFQHIGLSMRGPIATWVNVDMDVHILETLVATKIPASFLEPSSYYLSTTAMLYPDTRAIIAHFSISLQDRILDSQDSDSTHKPLLNQAFGVVCAWLRSHFNLFFQDAPTVKVILDLIILGDHEDRNAIGNTEYPALYTFRRLIKYDTGFHCVCRVFPEIDNLELYSGILERYLAMTPDTRRAVRETDPDFTLTEFYLRALGPNRATIPNFCHRLEQIVLGGITALKLTSSSYMTSESCIFRFLYGEECYVDSDNQLAIGDHKLSDILNSHSAEDEMTRGIHRLNYVAYETDRLTKNRTFHTYQQK
ncbi:hypothetical protein D9619_003287 [Psilocybe cf. subviscida]|uniref:NACHT domain-containing protein n=1 Tax=Psilocybe cf. subviscida TaxID=2480587 RepID=A0A8H5EUW7_9AGAR|nr:hypothetical protein D9619_003287 [Psilocybe cf. subviscida]